MYCHGDGSGDLTQNNMVIHNIIYRLYSESVEIRDLESRGPWAVAAERSEDATKGLRLKRLTPKSGSHYSRRQKNLSNIVQCNTVCFG